MGKDKYSKPVVQRSKEIMTVKEVAEFLKLTTITVYKLAKSKKLASFRIGNSIRFYRVHIEAMGQTETE